MAENYVNRIEFDALKNEVDEVKASMKDNKQLLQKIDKQIDVILTKLENTNSIEELKIKTVNDNVSKLEKQIEKVESNQTWLWRAIIGAVVGIILNFVF